MHDATSSNGKAETPLREIYWRAYGGWRAFVRSRLVWLATALLLVTFNYWLHCEWWAQVISVFPNLLGFTLGGFAVFVSVGDEKFKSIISGVEVSDRSGLPSPYLEICASFLHFALVQAVALLYAVVVNAINLEIASDVPSIMVLLDTVKMLRPVGYAVGYWLFLYGLCLTFAAGFGVFNISYLYDEYQSINRRQQ